MSTKSALAWVKTSMIGIVPLWNSHPSKPHLAVSKEVNLAACLGTPVPIEMTSSLSKLKGSNLEKSGFPAMASFHICVVATKVCSSLYPDLTHPNSEMMRGSSGLEIDYLQGYLLLHRHQSDYNFSLWSWSNAQEDRSVLPMCQCKHRKERHSSTDRSWPARTNEIDSLL